MLAKKFRVMMAAVALLLYGFGFVRPAQAMPGEVIYSGTNTNLVGDDGYLGSFPLGFNFSFYGTTYTSTYVNINGTLNFASGFGDYSNRALPYNSIGPSVEAFWDDIITKDFAQASIYYRTIGTAPNRKFITQWTNMYFYSDPSLPMGTFQAILYEGSNKVQIQYRDLLGGDEAKGNSATIGINKDGSTAQQVSLNTAALGQGQAISFTPDGGGGYTVNTAATYDLVYLADPAAPSPPTLTSPADGTPYQSTTPTLGWQAANQATSYRVLVATDVDFAHIVVNQASLTGTSYTLGSALNENARYFWKVEAINSTGSALSDTWSFKTLPPNDHDDVTPQVEDSAPNHGDANSDGTDDSLQASVASFVDSVNGQYASLAVSGCTGVGSATATPASANAVADTGYTYPAGLLDFRVTCAAPGSTATITQYYYGVSPTGLILRKYNAATRSYQTVTGATVTSVIIGGQQAAKVVYTVTDGSALDEDGAVNGTIVDPAGLAAVLPAAVTNPNPAAPNTGIQPEPGGLAGSLGALGLLGLAAGLVSRRSTVRRR